jgi:hypothetical protein
MGNCQAAYPILYKGPSRLASRHDAQPYITNSAETAMADPSTATSKKTP